MGDEVKDQRCSNSIIVQGRQEVEPGVGDDEREIASTRGEGDPAASSPFPRWCHSHPD
jgi:hypothetical protein